MSDHTSASQAAPSVDLERLASQLRSAPQKTQIQLLQQLASLEEAGENLLREFLLERQPLAAMTANAVDGKAYQLLLKTNSPDIKEFLQNYFPTGIVPLRSERNIDYTQLQKLLARQEFQAADRLTIEKLCELAGTGAIQRKWLYFTEVENFPNSDLQTINNLWLVSSEGKFGFSVQREIWLSIGKNWDKLWSKIGWKNENNWTRYPQEFTWDLTAPRGHLPLSNQLRGVRAMASLLTHPVWD